MNVRAGRTASLFLVVGEKLRMCLLTSMFTAVRSSSGGQGKLLLSLPIGLP